MADFVRINAPRIEKIIATLAMIEKSAKSQKASQAEQEGVYKPLKDYLGMTVPKEPETTVAPAQSPHVAKHKDRLAAMSTQDLVDLMIAAGALLQDRRK